MQADSRLLANLEYNLGPVVMAGLHDPEVIEIILNSDGSLWMERLGQDMEIVGAMSAAQGRLVISLVASALETVVTAQDPIVEGDRLMDRVLRAPCRRSAPHPALQSARRPARSLSWQAMPKPESCRFLWLRPSRMH